MNYDINTPRLIYPKDIIEINNNIWIEKGLYIKRGTRFYDISLHKFDKEIFIGRFLQTFDNLSIKYNKGKILVFNWEFIEESVKIVEVLALYRIIDDMFYSCTESEALNIFDPSISTKYLKNKDKLIIREDVEKTNQLVIENDLEKPNVLTKRLK